MKKYLDLSSWSRKAAIGSMLIVAFAVIGCDDSSSASAGPNDEPGVESSSSSGMVTDKVGEPAEPAEDASSSSEKVKQSNSSSSVDPVSSSSFLGDKNSSSSGQNEASSSSLKAESSSSDENSQSSSSKDSELAEGFLTDSRDGQTYKTVTIGTQTWMAENLNYADSVMTPSLKGRSWCYDNNADSCAKYGRLYTWAAAIDSVALQNQDDNLICGYGRFCKSLLKKQGLCPDSWHLPDTTEWKMLFEAVGGQGVAGKALKTQSSWSDNSGGTNDYGFSALPSGFYREYDGFSYVNHLSNFWTATETTSYTSYYISLESVGDAANRYDISKGNAFSVRCLKD